MSRVLRAAAGVVGLIAANAVAGRLIIGPLHNLPVEHRLNHDLRRAESPRTAAMAAGISRSSDTAQAITAGAVLSALLWSGGRGREAAVPAVALALAAASHLISSLVVGRARPGLPRLGTHQPTSSFPSGHVGAMTTLAVSLDLGASTAPAPLRVAVRTVVASYLLLLGWSRLYNGQHYASDVLAGYLNGAVCAILAHDLLREHDR